jgi:predicted nucleotidyltransferase
MQTTEVEVLPEIVRRLVAEFDPEEIILFGSRAWGQPHADSDYDLMVIVSMSDERPTRRATKAYERLRGIGVPTDVIVSTRQEFDRFSGVVSSLQSQILKQGKVLYGRSQTRSGTKLAAQDVP